MANLTNVFSQKEKELTAREASYQDKVEAARRWLEIIPVVVSQAVITLIEELSDEEFANATTLYKAGDNRCDHTWLPMSYRESSHGTRLHPAKTRFIETLMEAQKDCPVNIFWSNSFYPILRDTKALPDKVHTPTCVILFEHIEKRLTEELKKRIPNLSSVSFSAGTKISEYGEEYVELWLHYDRSKRAVA